MDRRIRVVQMIDKISSNTTLDNTYEVVLVDASAGPVTVGLPGRGSLYRDKTYRVKKIDASDNVVSVEGPVDNGNSVELKVRGQSCLVICDGTQWWQLTN